MQGSGFRTPEQWNGTFNTVDNEGTFNSNIGNHDNPCKAFLSAYDLARKNGFKGTEQEWLDSLIGPQGIQGIQGPQGNEGYTPQRGVDYWTDSDIATIQAYIDSKTEHYEGPTEVTPSNVTQVLQTKKKILDENIIINPIPSNYGLITYNGFELTVS